MPHRRNRQGLLHPGFSACLDRAPPRKRVGRSGSLATRWVEVRAKLRAGGLQHPVSGGPAPVLPQSAVDARPSLQTAGAEDSRDPLVPSETVRSATRTQFLMRLRPEVWKGGRATLFPPNAPGACSVGQGWCAWIRSPYPGDLGRKGLSRMAPDRMAPDRRVWSQKDAPDPVFASDRRLSLQTHPGGGMRHEPNRPPGSHLPADPLFLSGPKYPGRTLRGRILPAWVLFLPETSLLRDARRTSADGGGALR